MFTLWEVTRVAIDAASHLLTVQLRGDGDEGDDVGAVPEDDAPVLQQLGVAVRPVVSRTLRALGYQDDDVWVLKLWDKARSPTDVAEGETRLYAAGSLTVRIRLRADRLDIEAQGARITLTSAGAVEIAAAASQNVTLNGGSLEVARRTDTVQVTIPIGAVLTAAQAGVPNAAPITLNGTITSGAPTVRA